MKKFKKRLFEIIQTANENDIASKIFDIVIIILILANVILVIVDTFKIPQSFRIFLNYFEVFSVIIFTIEYIARVFTADLLFPNLPPFKARIKYVFSFMALIDLLAILPFFIPFIIPIDLRVLRMLRIFRLLRIFKINRYTTALATVGSVFKSKKNELLSSVFVVLILMIIASVLMYSIENSAQPEAFDNAFSALWWAVATLTTVGYGDIYPITVFGKILSSVIALLSIGLVAVPAGIISAGFIEKLEKAKDDKTEKDKKAFCPYCGKKLK